MAASSLSFRLAGFFVLAGIGLGVGCAFRADEVGLPAEACLTLLGCASLFLFGLYYDGRPALDSDPLARLQVGLWSLGVATLTGAIAAERLGMPAGDPIAVGAPLIMIAGMLLFAYFFVRPESSSIDMAVRGSPDTQWRRFLTDESSAFAQMAATRAASPRSTAGGDRGAGRTGSGTRMVSIG